ncbi:MAG: phospho-sugar mutase [Spirochaetales bacterium]|nr:MAG: phospho-sugar mutase [Spirochaetales bacterium]
MTNGQIRNAAEVYIKNEKNTGFRKEVEDLLSSENWAELGDRFYRDLEFGTGGIRGILGGGFNRMNTFVVARATQGLANYVTSVTENKNPSAVIAFDSRHYSDIFAQTAAEVLCGNGIRVYLFSGLRPTPELSFAVRYFKADLGIVVTASHNPKTYNGYKVYWSDGGQVVPPHDTGIIAEVLSVGNDIRYLAKETALKENLLNVVDREVDGPYNRMIINHALRPEVINRHKSSFTAVYTPLHGAGRKPVEEVFRELGIRLITVPEQREPDGNFPTVAFPNPEEASALDMAITLAKKEKAGIVLGTDPDSDRLGVAVPDPVSGEWVLLSGNQTGSMLAEYMLSTLAEQNRLPRNPVIIKTIVTTELQRKIAEAYGVRTCDVLTGFKYIAEKIREFESTGENYIFGGEESYGYLVGTEVRDKDAVSAAAMVAELALYCLDKKMSLLDYLGSLYKKYGCFKELLISRSFPGQEGMIRMKKFMESLRSAPPAVLGGLKVKLIKDYNSGETLETATGRKEKIDLPKSDVLQFRLEGETVISVRPSGTEPKLKFYASARKAVSDGLEKAGREVTARLSEIEASILLLIDDFNRQETG